jgi:hypothetical protein
MRERLPNSCCRAGTIDKKSVQIQYASHKREAKSLPVLLLTVGIFVFGFVLGFLGFLIAQKLRGGIALAVGKITGLISVADPGS